MACQEVFQQNKPGALGDHRQLPGSEIQWLFFGGTLEGFNFDTVPIAALCD
jgi:hypothetical protein